jgi:tetratricopeptide (TPR) repeat protein
MRRFALFVMLGCWLGGCATAPRQSEEVLARTRTLPAAHVIKDVPFIEQSAGYCGPTALAIVMNRAGNKISVDEIARQVYTPGMKGSLQIDLISAARRNGMLAIPVEGVEALLTEVAAGNPVIVFENLALSWLPQWHYATVFGYDSVKKEVVMHSGPDAFKRESFAEFEKSWRLSKYWGLVVLPPARLAAFADELAHVRAAAALEQQGRDDEALSTYLRILQRWPGSLGASIGAANVSYGKKDFKRAAGFLVSATAAHPDSSQAWHNLAVAYGAVNDTVKARQSARRALEAAAPAERDEYRQRLQKWLQ